MSALDHGPIAPGRVDTIARQLMELGKYERAMELAHIMFDWWHTTPGKTGMADIDRTQTTMWWLGFASAASAALYGAQHRKSPSSALRRRIQGG